MPIMIAFIVGSMVVPLLARRIQPARLMGAGLGASAIGFLMLTAVGAGSGLFLVVTGSLVYALGLAPVFTLATDTLVGAAPPERAGAASALSETGSELGGALGIAVLGSIGTAVYRRAMVYGVPNGLSHTAGEAARGTLGGAIAVAQQLPTTLATELVGAAREAFTLSLALTAAASAIVVIATAVVVTVSLRNPQVAS
jgi:DHA2 family multidrug resistance protein-like MFS transporter